MDRRGIKHAALTVAITLAALGVGFVAFIFSGIYPIAANEQHMPFVASILTTVQQNSVRVRASGIEAPDLEDGELLRRGARLFEAECVVCHGAPGVARAVIGRGLNPDPPRLATEVQEWSDPELYWIIRNGLKMAGMPGFEAGHTEEDLWALVAVTRRLPTVSPPEWSRMVAAARAEAPVEQDVAWVAAGKDSLRYQAGDPDRGGRLVEVYGCGSCHVIPGVRLARGKVGPPLTDFGERHYIAGLLLNTPANLTAFILDPPAFEPHTAMPALGVLPEDAWDMAAYLLTLGAGPELGPPHPLPKAWLPLPPGKTAENVVGAPGTH